MDTAAEQAAQAVAALQKRLDDANDVYELIKAATQVMQSGGTFTPTAATPYPDTTGISTDTQWLVRFDQVDAAHTFASGDLQGKTVHSGDILFYNTPSNAFIVVPSAQSQLLNDAVSKATADAKAYTDTQKQALDSAITQATMIPALKLHGISRRCNNSLMLA